MKKLSGRGVYGAVAIGTASVFRRHCTSVCCTHIDDTEGEIKRAQAAKELAVSQLSEIYEKVSCEAGEAAAQIIELHMMMLEDDDYNKSIESIIRTQKVNAEYAVKLTCDSFSKMFSSMEDNYMQGRAADVKDISGRLIGCLSRNGYESTDSAEQLIICADDLAPSETALLDKSRVLAFVTASGSVNSHTAILAAGMNIPAVVNVGDDLLNLVRDGDKLIVDAGTGDIIIGADEQTEREYFLNGEEYARRKALLLELKGKPDMTKDGRKINIFANISSTNGISAALENDAGGIGLFRSEFLFLESSSYPTEEKQFTAYRQVLESMKGKKVIIRTLDIGADKRADYFQLEREENPALGLRAVRLCLKRRDIFITQLRALYRASVYGKLSIMFPMITSVSEVEKCLEACEEAKRGLKAEGIPYSGDVTLGIMIETPAAAVISDLLAPLVDFFSVGTNDLTQYTLACDRQNPALEEFADTRHEAVMRLIRISAENAHKCGIKIGICGELAADTSLTENFITMGIDELSVSPPYILNVREKVRSLDLS